MLARAAFLQAHAGDAFNGRQDRGLDRPPDGIDGKRASSRWTRCDLQSLTECRFINTPRVTSIRFDPMEPETVWATIEIDGLYRSRDRGAGWEDAGLPRPINSTIWWIGTNPADPMLIFCCTVMGQIFRSTDGGESWRRLDRELGELRMIAWQPNGRG